MTSTKTYEPGFEIVDEFYTILVNERLMKGRISVREPHCSHRSVISRKPFHRRGQFVIRYKGGCYPLISVDEMDHGEFKTYVFNVTGEG